MPYNQMGPYILANIQRHKLLAYFQRFS